MAVVSSMCLWGRYCEDFHEQLCGIFVRVRFKDCVQFAVGRGGRSDAILSGFNIYSRWKKWVGLDGMFAARAVGLV